MKITQQQHRNLEQAALPLIAFLNANCHPHCKVIVENDSVELVEGLAFTPKLDQFEPKQPESLTKAATNAVGTCETCDEPNHRFAVYPGNVRSRNDGQVHYVTFAQLCQLYGVNPAECRDMSDPKWWRESIEGMVVLRPRFDGNYTLPPHE